MDMVWITFECETVERIGNNYSAGYHFNAHKHDEDNGCYIICA